MEEHVSFAVEASTQYVGRWNRLVSTTNWEKGRIICEWREALHKAGAPAAESTDEAWSRQVGNVTPQHVGRLRRVFERFGDVCEQYAGLYWSHFQAAVEWPDAEMYLEGAVQSDWSVAEMRQQRCEATGGQPETDPFDADSINAEFDEDGPAAYDEPMPNSLTESLGEVHDTERAERRERESSPYDEVDEPDASDIADLATDEPALPPVRPFEALPPLPSDLNEAFELMKLAILNHKVSDWREISRNDVLAVLESLRQLALAPAGNG